MKQTLILQALKGQRQNFLMASTWDVSLRDTEISR